MNIIGNIFYGGMYGRAFAVLTVLLLKIIVKILTIGQV